jgi:Nucleotidyl transferase AbiEii toxin, Type IV TA system
MRPTRETTEGRTYLDLQKRARRDRRPFEELLTLYALEGFLARLAVSPHAANLVLKGGLLLAAYDARRPTRDADFAARYIAGQIAPVTGVVQQIARIPLDDGLAFNADSARGETIREEDFYSGVRVHVDCRLATARTNLKVDVNVGDAISPEPKIIHLPRLLDGGVTIDLIGYPLSMVHAEKIVTALQRGVVNTRWRDFADIYLLAHHQAMLGSELRESLDTVADHRGVQLAPLMEALGGYAEVPGVQAKWAAWRRRHELEDRLPERFAEVLSQVGAFADPVIQSSAINTRWEPDRLAWVAATAQAV